VSRPARDAWIETVYVQGGDEVSKSRPARDAWIETYMRGSAAGSTRSRPARDAWIETNDALLRPGEKMGRVPRGTRGLKRRMTVIDRGAKPVASRAGRVD